MKLKRKYKLNVTQNSKARYPFYRDFHFPFMAKLNFLVKYLRRSNQVHIWTSNAHLWLDIQNIDGVVSVKISSATTRQIE